MPDFFGLDLGHHNIKIAKVIDKKLTNVGIFPTPAGSYGSEDPYLRKLMVEGIKSAMQAAKINSKNVVVALPDNSVMSRLEVGFPALEDLELNEAIIYEARKYISYPIEEMRLDKIIVGEKIVDKVKLIDVFWVATTKSLVERYISLLKLADLNCLALETESIANARLVNQFSRNKKLITQENESVVIVDVGSEVTVVTVSQNDKVLFCQTLGNGSDSMSRIIAMTFNLDIATADNYKKTYGLDPSYGGGKLAQVLDPLVKSLVDQIQKTISFFRSKLPSIVPTKIFFTGDGSQLLGLTKYSEEILKTPTFLVDAFDSIELSKEITEIKSRFSSSGFSVAIGLAMKEK